MIHEFTFTNEILYETLSELCYRAIKSRYQPFKRQFNKMVKRTQTIRRQFADELFESVWPFYGIGA